MRVTFFISLLVLLIGNLTAQKWNKKNIDRLYNDIINEYGTSELKRIFTTQKKFPYLQWINNTNNHNSIVIDLEIVIHEMQHGMADFTYGESIYNYYLNDSCIVDVEITPYFETDELNLYIPKTVSDSIFRYGIYVGKKDEFSGYKKKFDINNERKISSSIFYGIFGLMEEFLAYYRGLQVLYQVYPYYVNYLNTHNFSKEEKESELEKYKYQAYENINSFYEFQLFIAWYLLYAKKEKTEIYKKLYENKPLRYLFSYVHQSFLNLVENCIMQLDTIPLSQQNYQFLNYIELNDTEEDLCKYIYYSDIVTDEYREILIEVNENHAGEKRFRFIGDRKERRFFKKEYNQFKKILFRDFKDISSARLMNFLCDVEAQMQFLKRQTTNEIIEEVSKFKTLDNNERFCRTYE